MALRYIDILKNWNFWEKREIDTGIRRSKYLTKISQVLAMPEIVALSGVRRCGKSTILLQTIEDLHRQHDVSYDNTLYLNFEDPRLGDSLQAKDLFNILSEYKTNFKPKGRIYMFLDEVQNVNKWEKFCRAIYDQKDNVKVFVTGSTSKSIDSDLIGLLSGRLISITVTPLSFNEFLDFKKQKKSSLRLTSLFNEYLQYGGFPRVVLEKSTSNKINLLISYYETIIEKDVILKHDIKNKTELKNLTRFVLSNIGNQISSYGLEKALSVSSENISRYLNFLEEAFIIFRIPLFSYSVKRQIYNPDKIFSVDSGLSNIAGFRFSENKGRLLENLVFGKLKETGSQIYYWKNKTEIDFLTYAHSGVQKLINVTSTVDDQEILQRELFSLSLGKQEFKNAKTELITLFNESEQKNKIIRSLIEFLLR